MRGNNPLAPNALAAGLIVAIVGGIVVAIIVGEGRFATAIPTVNAVQKDTLAAPTPTATTLTAIPATKMPPTQIPVPTCIQDCIEYYAVAEINANMALIQVWYKYDKSHGNNVCLGAVFLDKGQLVGGGGYNPGHALTESGAVTIRIAPRLINPQTSDELEVFMYQCGGATFASRRFPFVQTWQP